MNDRVKEAEAVKDYVGGVKEIHVDPTTSCKECVFAAYAGTTQVGCELGRIEKFKARGDEVIEAFDGENGEIKSEFFIVKRRCSAYREEAWANKLTTGTHHAIEEELKTIYDIILMFDQDGVHDDYREISDDIDNIFCQEFLPRKIIIVNKTGDIGQIISGVRDSFARNNNEHDGTNVLYDVVDVQEALSHAAKECVELVAHNRYMIDEGYRHVDAQWYMVWKSGQLMWADRVYWLDNYINYQLGKVCMLRADNESNHGFCILSFLHKTLGGFMDTKGRMVEAMEELSEIDDKQHMIKDWGEIDGST